MGKPNLVNPFGSPHERETGISKGYQRDADRETGLNVVIVAERMGLAPNALHLKYMIIILKIPHLRAEHW